jgi:hypothetical protein
VRATHAVKIEHTRMFLRSLGLLMFLDETMRNRLSVKNMLDRISSMIIDIVLLGYCFMRLCPTLRQRIEYKIIQ